ncbi:carbohydrate ABC transporter permease [Thalassospira xianhensis]|uniref:Sugar ABC transporter ATP-binding protein n=1 Tax=Thalassospira xianhensis MCCC 1A02616 TaxID=1177929 RepID=A0A367UD36_9PROT|nr:carbohydrate ABC transporter permease [Thalassospira xianhensis]RCK04962.1 sugar ABC transporter ATP-binding protein [Thalassospira xianhensis MCCC 1A02616]UKV15092.1 carbohydrate ABC transporter permease [Thalassospiraceae bacterium SW-3-3]
MNYRTQQKITRICWIVGLCALAIPFVFPFLWMLSGALKGQTDVFASSSLVPAKIHWSNFSEVFAYQPFARQYFNSLYIAIVVTIATLFISSMAGYALARLRFGGSAFILLVLVSALMMPEEVTIIPNFFLMKELGLMNSHMPLILLPLFGSQGVMATFLMRQYFLALPKELEEAGRMDGLSRFGVYFKIALPLSKPALSAVGIITFLFSWNLFLEPLVFVNDIELFTLPLALANFTDTYGLPLWHLQLAATALAVIPMLIVYVLAQRQIVESFAMSGVKG